MLARTLPTFFNVFIYLFICLFFVCFFFFSFFYILSFAFFLFFFFFPFSKYEVKSCYTGEFRGERHNQGWRAWLTSTTRDGIFC